LSHGFGYRCRAFAWGQGIFVKRLGSGHCGLGQVTYDFKYSEVLGSTFQQKVQSLSGLRANSALEFATKVGFVCHQQAAGQLLIIPAEYFVATLTCKGGAEMMRWRLHADAKASASHKLEAQEVFNTLKSLVGVFPSLNKSCMASG
jgi:hypothetical protein